MQQLCYRSKCLFIRSDGAITESLPTAIGWVSEKEEVKFYYKGEFIGDLKFIGIVESVEDLGETPAGAVYNSTDNSYYIGIPDEFLEN